MKSKRSQTCAFERLRKGSNHSTLKGPVWSWFGAQEDEV